MTAHKRIPAQPARPCTTTGRPVVQVRELTMAYGGTDVLHGIDLDVHRGEVFALLGPNGRLPPDRTSPQGGAERSDVRVDTPAQRARSHGCRAPHRNLA